MYTVLLLVISLFVFSVGDLCMLGSWPIYALISGTMATASDATAIGCLNLDTYAHTSLYHRRDVAHSMTDARCKVCYQDSIFCCFGTNSDDLHTDFLRVLGSIVFQSLG